MVGLSATELLETPSERRARISYLLFNLANRFSPVVPKTNQSFFPLYSFPVINHSTMVPFQLQVTLEMPKVREVLNHMRR